MKTCPICLIDFRKGNFVIFVTTKRKNIIKKYYTYYLTLNDDTIVVNRRHLGRVKYYDDYWKIYRRRVFYPALDPYYKNKFKLEKQIKYFYKIKKIYKKQHELNQITSDEYLSVLNKINNAKKGHCERIEDFNHERNKQGLNYKNVEVKLYNYKLKDKKIKKIHFIAWN